MTTLAVGCWLSCGQRPKKLLWQLSRNLVHNHFSGLHVCVLNCVFYRPQTKSTVKKQLSQKGRKSRKQESSAEEDDDDDDDDDEDEDEEDTPKRQTRRRGATKVKRCISDHNLFFSFRDFDLFLYMFPFWHIFILISSGIQIHVFHHNR